MYTTLPLFRLIPLWKYPSVLFPSFQRALAFSETFSGHFCLSLLMSLTCGSNIGKRKEKKGFSHPLSITYMWGQPKVENEHVNSLSLSHSPSSLPLPATRVDLVPDPPVLASRRRAPQPASPGLTAPLLSFFSFTPGLLQRSHSHTSEVRPPSTMSAAARAGLLRPAMPESSYLSGSSTCLAIVQPLEPQIAQLPHRELLAPPPAVVVRSTP